METFKPDKFPLPVDLILKLFNNLPQNSPLRENVIEFIKTYTTKIDTKGHTAEGFRLKEDGELIFDEILYTEAVYRGKVETYTRGAKEAIEKLRSAFEMLKVMGNNHDEISGLLSQYAIQQRVGEGIPISEEQAKLLSKLAPLLLNDRA
jgi:hypothetical protein